MKNILLFFTCLLACGNLFAQTPADLRGDVRDEQKQGIPFVPIQLFRLGDSMRVAIKESDVQGRFDFSSLPKGEYILRIRFQGFQFYETPPISFKGAPIVLGSIDLKPEVALLREVVIETTKPFVEQRADKTILNVENSIVATGNSVLEVLEKAPGVTIDRQNEQIKLNHKSGITVMIDGRPNLLSGADLTTLLSQMNSDQVSSIELISNPSSKYDAAGNAGIINIRLKRNKAYGTNGFVSLNAGRGFLSVGPADLYRGAGMLNLNHRHGKWNVYGNGGVSRKVNFNAINVLRNTSYQGLASAFDQNFSRTSSGWGYNGKVGADYYASEKTIIGMMIDGTTVDVSMNNLSKTYIQDVQGGLTSKSMVNQTATSHSPFQNLTANLNLRHDFSKESSLSMDMDYAGFGNRKQEFFDADYLNGEGMSTSQTQLKNRIKTLIDMWAFRADFNRRINALMTMETGFKGVRVNTDNDFVAEKSAGGSWQNEVGKSNHFLYGEAIYAAYVNLATEWKSWKIQSGLRAEHTASKGETLTDRQEISRRYLSLFPTLFVQKILQENHSLRFSYSRRVDRPNYQQLNPFVFYMDPYALDQGNPYLKPQFTGNFELNYTYRQTGFTLGYARTKDLITQISQQNDETRIVNVIRENLGEAHYYSAALYFPLKLTKAWSTQQNIALNYNRFTDGNLEGAAYQAGRMVLNLNSNHSFKLPRQFMLELNFWYLSPRVHGVERTTISQYALNAGLQKSFKNKQWRLRLSADDVLSTNHWEGRLQYQNVDLSVVNRFVSTRVALSVNYNFGNQQVKSARSRNTATDDMKNRAGNG